MKYLMMYIKIIAITAVFGFLLTGCPDSESEEEAYLKIINQHNEPIVMVEVGDKRYDNLNINDSKDFTVSLVKEEYWVDVLYGNSNLRQCFVEFKKGKMSVIILNPEGDLQVYVDSSGNKGPLVD